LKAAQLDEYNRTLIAALEGDPSGILDRTRRTLDFMEAGMRFT
jgi:hypothetical protein